MCDTLREGVKLGQQLPFLLLVKSKRSIVELYGTKNIPYLKKNGDVLNVCFVFACEIFPHLLK